MVPVFKINGITAITVALYVVIIFGTLHLLALSFPDSKWAKAWILLGF